MATTTITTTKELPFWLKLLLNMAAQQIEDYGESLLVGLLQKLHDKNVEQWKGAIYGLWGAQKALMPLVAASPNTYDDGLVLELKKTCIDSVALNPNDGVTLT